MQSNRNSDSVGPWSQGTLHLTGQRFTPEYHTPRVWPRFTRFHLCFCLSAQLGSSELCCRGDEEGVKLRAKWEWPTVWCRRGDEIKGDLRRGFACRAAVRDWKAPSLEAGWRGGCPDATSPASGPWFLLLRPQRWIYQVSPSHTSRSFWVCKELVDRNFGLKADFSEQYRHK